MNNDIIITGVLFINVKRGLKKFSDVGKIIYNNKIINDIKKPKIIEPNTRINVFKIS